MKAQTIKEGYEDVLKGKSEDEMKPSYNEIKLFSRKLRSTIDEVADIADINYGVEHGNLVITIEFDKPIELDTIDDVLYAFNATNVDSIADGKIINFMVPLNDIFESIGGAGYSVYGGGGGGGYGNPSSTGRFGGRGFGFGASNLGGGPNIMYTYAVKPLNHDLEPRPTTQEDPEQTIHTGSKIKGHVLDTGKEISGSIIHVEEDEDNNIKWYVVLDDEGIKQHVDPTSAYIDDPEEHVDPFIEDMAIGEVQESFYPLVEEEGEEKAEPNPVEPTPEPKQNNFGLKIVGPDKIRELNGKGKGKPPVLFVITPEDFFGTKLPIQVKKYSAEGIKAKPPQVTLNDKLFKQWFENGEMPMLVITDSKEKIPALANKCQAYQYKPTRTEPSGAQLKEEFYPNMDEALAFDTLISIDNLSKTNSNFREFTNHIFDVLRKEVGDHEAVNKMEWAEDELQTLYDKGITGERVIDAIKNR